MIAPKELEDLPENVARALTSFVGSAVAAFGSDLKSAILYGSGAEGRLRAASDVNLLLVLSSFDAAKAEAIRQPFAAAHAAIQLPAMFLLERDGSYPPMEHLMAQLNRARSALAKGRLAKAAA